MAVVKNGLQELHVLLQQLHVEEQAMERGPKQVQAKRQATAGKETELAAQREKIKALRAAADKKSLQLKTNEARLADFQTKLNQCASNKEYQILQTQMDADRMANSVLEDEILDSLEQVDAAQQVAKKIEQEIVACQAEEKRVAAKVTADEGQLKARIAELKEKVAAAESPLTGETRVVYERLKQAHGPEALTEVSGKTCSSCYVSMPPQTMVEIRQGLMVFCRTCGRLMYISEED